MLFIPHPDSAHLHYLFHQTLRDPAYEFLAKNLYSTTLDTRGNGGLGSVKTEKKLLTITTANQKLAMNQLTATKHANGKDWWLVQSLADISGFISFLVKDDTIIAQSAHYPVSNAMIPNLWQAKFSPDGLTYVRIPSFLIDTGFYQIEIYDFDRCTGKLNNRKLVNLSSSFVGGSIAISPNNRYLYATTNEYNTWPNTTPLITKLYQYDLWAADVEASKAVIVVMDSTNQICPYLTQCTILGFMQLAADNKIYMGGSVGYLHTINNPDAQGQACGFQAHSIVLGSYIYQNAGLPNFPNYRLGAMEDSLCWTTKPVREEDIINSSERVDAEGIKLYPNPASEAITVEISDISGAASIEIIDMLGVSASLHTQVSNQKTTVISVAHLPAGVYSCKVKSERGVWVQQFIISK